jgi:hypothetical protein
MALSQGKKDNSRRKGIPAQLKDAKRTEATARQTAYDKLTIDEKIARLDAGGFIATKQRAKLVAKKGSKK